MTELYIDCLMGAAGDMLTAMLLDIMAKNSQIPAASIAEELNTLGLPGVRYSCEQVTQHESSGLHVEVAINGEIEGECECAHAHHHHHSMRDIEEIINASTASLKAKDDAINVYKIIAEAESRAHGVPVTEVHFHEVGAMDAVADVLAVCELMAVLAPDRVIVSPVHVGNGNVKCAHGVLPVPAPATAFILEDVPHFKGSIMTELCTPTGAALLRYFGTEFVGDQFEFAKCSAAFSVRSMTVEGAGFGRKQFEEIANCVRGYYGKQ